jgi:hypothetical protein
MEHWATYRFVQFYLQFRLTYLLTSGWTNNPQYRFSLYRFGTINKEFKISCKITLTLRLTNWALFREAYGGSERIDPCILGLGISWRWVVSFTFMSPCYWTKRTFRIILFCFPSFPLSLLPLASSLSVLFFSYFHIIIPLFTIFYIPSFRIFVVPSTPHQYSRNRFPLGMNQFSSMKSYISWDITV